MQGLFTSTIIIALNLLLISNLPTPSQAASVESAMASKITPELQKEFEAGNNVKTTFLVEMKGGTQKVIDDFAVRRYASQEAYQEAYGKALKELAASSQKNVLAFLENAKKEPNRQGMTYESIELTNIVIVRQGDYKLAQDLANFDEVGQIIHDGKVVGF